MMIKTKCKIWLIFLKLFKLIRIRHYKTVMILVFQLEDRASIKIMIQLISNT